MVKIILQVMDTQKVKILVKAKMIGHNVVCIHLIVNYKLVAFFQANIEMDQ